MASDDERLEVFPGASFFGHQSGRSRLHPSSSARNIFPLPLPATPEDFAGHGWRSGQRAAGRKQQAIKSTEAVPGYRERVQVEVLDKVHFCAGLCHDKGSLDHVPRPKAALRELLRGRIEYGSDQPTILAACVLERISLPQSLEGAPRVDSLLGEEARRFLGSPLARRRESVQEDHQDAGQGGIPDLHTACGVFFVKKSDGQKIRMIIDARGTNRSFKEPRGTTSSFSRR